MPFVKPDHVMLYAVDPPSCTTPLQVVDYLASTEAAAFFLRACASSLPVLSHFRRMRQPLSRCTTHCTTADPVSPKECPQYYTRIKAPIDLSTMAKYATAGVYAEEGTGSRGIAGLWSGA